MRECAKDSRPPTSPSPLSAASSPWLLSQAPAPHRATPRSLLRAWSPRPARDTGTEAINGQDVKTHHPPGTRQAQKCASSRSCSPLDGGQEHQHHLHFRDGEPEQRGHRLSRTHQPVHTPGPVDTPRHNHTVFRCGHSPEHANLATLRPTEASRRHPFTGAFFSTHVEAFTSGKSGTLHLGLSFGEVVVKPAGHQP